MFGWKKKDTVPGLLNEGRSWTERLSAAADEAQQEAESLTMEAKSVVAVAKVQAANINDVAGAFQIDADEGHAIAANYKNLLKVSK